MGCLKLFFRTSEDDDFLRHQSHLCALIVEPDQRQRKPPGAPASWSPVQKRQARSWLAFHARVCLRRTQRILWQVHPPHTLALKRVRIFDRRSWRSSVTKSPPSFQQLPWLS